MPKFDEKSLVEDYFIQELQKRGWSFVHANQLERETLDESILLKTLARALKKLNEGSGISEVEINKVINELKLRTNGPEDVKDILNYFKKGVPIKFESDRTVRYVKIFDYENPNSNEYVVSRQIPHIYGDNEIRNDIILYVNGIPLVNIECKNPASFSETWFDAYKQIKRYEREIPELYKYVQIGVGAEQKARYFPIVPWSEDVMTHEWREEGKDPIDSTIELLASSRLLDILKNYLFYRIEHGSATKVITRYMQYRASEKIVNRVLGGVAGTEQLTKGLVWHWQGSGKTLTMIFAANKLYNAIQLENPTIFFVVDRDDLEKQLYDEFTALDITKPELVKSIENLREVIRHDGGRGKRGILITLIHKFNPEKFKELQKELDVQSGSEQTILNRKNVIAFVDEGHRTQYGTLAVQMRSILKGARFFAFTGTPIAKPNRDTYMAFSNLPNEKYIDKYFITDSTNDGFTVKIAFQPRLEAECGLRKEQLDTFLQVEDEEVPEELKEDVKSRVGNKLNAINVFLENPERIRVISGDIAKHFKENVDGKFKAMVVGANRVACVRYKQELDKLLPTSYSEIVMSPGRLKDAARNKIVQDYLERLREKHRGKDTEDIMDDIVTKFKEEDIPKILIVTDMLLTGFDAPILQTMYLDKPLKEHKLLQAVARVNRPYKDIKTAGVVIDYVGVLKNYKKTLETYSKDEIKGALYDPEELREEFTSLIKETLDLFKSVPKDNYNRETMLKAIEVITSDEESGKLFVNNYKQLRKTYELLGIDEKKLQYFNEYKWLTAVYTYYTLQVLRQYSDEMAYIQKYFGRTLKYVYKTVELDSLIKELPTVEFDSEYLKNLETKVKSKEEKAANVVFTLNKFILTDKGHAAVPQSLIEKVERIVKHWKDRAKDFERIYNEGTAVISEINELKRRQDELGFNDLEYSILVLLEDQFGKSGDLSTDVKSFYDGTLQPKLFKGWYSQYTARRDIETEIRRFLRKYMRERKLSYSGLQKLYDKILDDVIAYGTKS